MSVKEILDSLEWGPAPESDSFARDWLSEHGPDFGMYIDGGWRHAASGENFETRNPADNQLLGTISQAGEEEVNAAVAAARAALPGWSSSPGHVRARYLYAIARQVQKHHRLLAVLETLDNGKPIRETRAADIPLVARHFYHHAGWAQLFDETFPGYGPVGVCGQVIPWNFPLLMLAWKIAPAIAAGNTVVLKPAEFTSISALAFAAICESVGLPPGVVNIVTGDGRTGALITEHEDIDKVAFTGSTEVFNSFWAAIRPTARMMSGRTISTCCFRNPSHASTSTGRGSLLSGGRHLRIFVIKTSSLSSPAARSISVRTCPAFPTNGFPCASSLAPGASPMTIHFAL